MKPIPAVLIFSVLFFLPAVSCAEEVVVLRGDSSDLQQAIKKKMKRENAEGAGFAMATHSPETGSSSRKVPSSGEGYIVPAPAPAFLTEPPKLKENTAYDRTLKLTPHREFSRDLERHDSFDDELAQSYLKELRDGYSVDESEEDGADIVVIH